MDKKCLKCGNCCKYITICVPIESIASRDLHWLEVHDAIIGKINKTLAGIRIPHRCKYLMDNNECSIYYEDRPETCKRFVPGTSDSCKVFKNEEYR